ncbi:hypothetical protein ACWIGW_46025 [Nocardia brasiliensis]
MAVPAGGFGGLLRRLSEVAGELTAATSSCINAIIGTLRTDIVRETVDADEHGGRAILGAGNPPGWRPEKVEQLDVCVVAGRATAVQTPDLSSVPSLKILLEVPPDQATPSRLLRRLEGLGGRYGPFTVKVTDADYMYRSDGSVYGLTFSGVVLDGPQIGQFRREVVRNDATGLIHVDHKHLSVAKTGTGFGTLFADALENYYRRSGVDRIYLVAGYDNGGYTWARAGYGWDLEADSLQESIQRIRDKALGAGDAGRVFVNELSAADAAMVRRVMRRFDGPIDNWPSPRELAGMAGENPKLGKLLMTGTRWPGVKIL